MSQSLEHLNFYSLLDALPDASLLVDGAGCVMMGNSAACALLGYAEDEICGLKVEKLIPEIYRERHEHLRQTYAKKPQKRSMGYGGNLLMLTRDGRELPISIGLAPLKGCAKPITLVTFVGGRLYQAENALRTAEEHLQLAKNVAGFGVFECDLIHNTLHMDDYAHALWWNVLDENADCNDVDKYIHPEDISARHDALKRALEPARNGEYRVEFRIHNENGIERWISTYGRVNFLADKPVQLVGVMQDITEQKRMEERFLEQRDDRNFLLQQHIALQTASAIAHEINQPLTAISAYSEVALHSLESGNVNEKSLFRALEGCVTQSQRAGKSLHELLDFLHKGESHVEPTDINQVVMDALAMAKRDSYGKFNPVLQLEAGIPPVLCNVTQVQKVLLNLFRNSVEAIQGAGMSIASITITVRTLRENNMAQVTVQDSGPGFDRKTVERIFEPFFTTKSRGIGMGLAISRSLIEANGGQLWHDVDSESGAVIHFTLPLAPGALPSVP